MNHPHSPYLVMFAVGAFSEIKDSWNGISVHYYCEKGREEDTKRAFGKTPKILQFFSERIGTVYPYERYSQVAVADFIFGGMEHTTMTTQTDYALHDERAAEESWSEGLVAHELAHQWFGDLLTCKDWSHAWLNESFATYFDALFLEYDRGTEEFQYDIYKNAQTYFAEDKDRYRRPICTSLFKRPADLFDRHLYEKGSVILHTIRSMLGDELWWKTIKAYVETHSHGAVETNDLINALERTTGRNMRKFFDHWIFKAGHPELKVSYFWSDGKANIRVAQRQRLDEETPTFAFPLEIKVITKKGEHVFHEHVEKRQHLFSYKLAERPVDVRVDYRNIILKKMDVLKPRSMWLYQLENDEYVAGKIAACQEIARWSSAKACEALETAFRRETFWGIQNEIAQALSSMKSRQAFEVLKRCLAKATNVKAQRGIVAALGEFRQPETVSLVRTFLSDKKSYSVPAEAARTLGRTKQPEALAIIKKFLELESWNDVIRSDAVEGLVHLQDENVLPLVMTYCRKGVHARTRITALRMLPDIGRGDDAVLDVLIEATKDEYALVQLAAVVALGNLGDERSVPTLEALMKEKRDERVKRAAEEAIRKIYTWIDTDLDVERLRSENETLRQKLQGLEGSATP